MGELRIRSWELKGLKNILISTQALAIRENIGYPEYLTNKTALYSLFKGVRLTYSACSLSVIQHSLSIPFFFFDRQVFLFSLKQIELALAMVTNLVDCIWNEFFFIVLKPALVKMNNNVVDLFCCCLFFWPVSN